MNSANEKWFGGEIVRCFPFRLAMLLFSSVFVAALFASPALAVGAEDDKGGDLASVAWVYFEGAYSDTGDYYYLAIDGTLQPKVHVEGRNGVLIEGTDYTVEYDGFDDRQGDTAIGTAIVRGKGKYTGEVTKNCTVYYRYDLEKAISAPSHPLGTRFFWGDEVYSKNGGSHPGQPSSLSPQFFYIGKPVMPRLSLSYSSSQGGVYKTNCFTQSGGDFTISYLDADGKSCIPKEPGSYRAIITAADGSFLKGSAAIDFEIVTQKNVVTLFSMTGAWRNDYSSISVRAIGDSLALRGSETQYDYYPNFSSSHIIYGSSTDRTKYLFNISGLRASGSLIEGLDYVVKKLGDGVANTTVHDGAYSSVYASVYKSFAIEGIGAYSGFITEKVKELPISQDFKDQSFRVNGVYYSRYSNEKAPVTSDAEGTLLAPSIEDYPLAEGVDYRFAGYFDSNGSAVSIGSVGDCVTARIDGIGKYEGCSLDIPCEVSSQSNLIDISSFGTAGVVIDGEVDYGVKNEDGSYNHIACLLKSAVPNVGLRVYSQNVLLREGDGFTVEKQLGAAQDKLTVTAIGDPAFGYTGKSTTSYTLVDKYDLEKIAEYSVRATATVRGDNIGGTVAELDAAKIGKVNDATISYAGIPIRPYIKVWGGYRVLTEDKDYSVEFVDPNGVSSPVINSCGEWTAVVKGEGDWSGTHKIALHVLQDVGVNLANCEMTLGSVSDGNAAVTISYAGYTLKEGRDYTLKYGDSRSGYRWVQAKAVDGSVFYGSIAQSYAVPDENSSIDLREKCLLYLSPDFDKLGYPALGYGTSGPETYGNAFYRLKDSASVEPSVTVVFANGGTMQPLDPKYYDVKYANNDAPGNAVVTVTGKNGYTGTLSMNFTILPNGLTASVSTNPVEIGRVAEFACVVGNLEGCTVSYQWQQSSNGGASWRDCAAKGSDTAEMSYTLTEARRGYLFRCVVTASDGRAATSNAQGFVLVDSVDSDSMPAETADEEEPIED